MSDDEDYHDHQRNWEDLKKWGEDHPEEWEENELTNNEELLALIDAERQGREQAREDHGDDADEGHDDRIQKLEDTAQTVRNRIAYCKGEYSHDDGEQADEADPQEAEPQEEEQDNGGGEEEMDISSDVD